MKILCVFCKTDTAETCAKIYNSTCGFNDYWVQCHHCEARGPLANSGEKARQLWLNFGQEWTRKTPEKSGYFWLIKEWEQVPCPVEVDIEFSCVVELGLGNSTPIHEFVNCWWMGPLYPPLAPTK